MADQDVQGMLVRIEATTAQLRRELEVAERAVGKASAGIDKDLSRVDDAFDRAGESAAGMESTATGALAGVSVAATAALAGLVALTAQTASAADEIGNLAALSNASVVEFQRQAAAARSVGIAQDQLASIYKDVNDKLGEFLREGGGELQSFFETIAPKIGITTAQLRELSGPQVLQALYTGMEKAGLSQQQLTTYMEEIADDATVLIPLLRNNGQGFEELGDQAERLGQVLSAVEIEQLAKLNSSINQLKGSIEGASNELVVAMLPAIQDVTDGLNQMSSNGAFETLGEGIGFLIGNLDIVTVLLGGTAAAAMTRYTMAVLESGVAIGKKSLATVEATRADLASASAASAAALADKAAALAELERIKAVQAALAAERVLEAERLKAQISDVGRQMSVARMAELRLAEMAVIKQQEAAERSLATATAASQAVASRWATAGKGLLSLLGGPVGLVSLVVSAGIAFLTLRDNTSLLEKKLGDIGEPLDRVTEKFNRLNRASQAVTLRELRAEIAKTEKELLAVSGSLADKFENSLRSGGAAGFGADGLIAGLVALPDTAQAALDRVRQASMDAANGVAVDWKAVADEVRQYPEVTEEMAQAIETGQVKAEELSAELTNQRQVLDRLTASVDQNTASINTNNSAKVSGAAAVNTAVEGYLKTLEDETQKIKDLSEREKALIWLKEQKIAVESEDGKRVLAGAEAADQATKSKEAEKKAEQEATQAKNAAATASKNATKQLSDYRAETDLAIDAAAKQAAAYRQGEAAVAQLARQEEIERQVLKLGEQARADVTARVNEYYDAVERRDLSKQSAELRSETDQLQAQAVATLKGRAALDEYNDAKTLSIALAGKSVDAQSAEGRALEEAIQKNREAARVLEQVGQADGIMDRLLPETKLLRDYTEQQGALNKAIELYPAKADQYREALRLLGLEYEKNRTESTTWGKWTQGALDRVDSAFADMWKGVGGGFGSFADGLKDSFAQLLAELAHMAITRPIIMQIGSALGIGGLAGQSSGIWGSLGGAGGSGLLGSVSKAYSLYQAGQGKGLLGSVWGGLQSGGLSGAWTGLQNYGSGLYSTAAGWLGGSGANSMALGATQAGYTGNAFNGWVGAQNLGAGLQTAASWAGPAIGAWTGYQQAGLKGAVVGGAASWAGGAAGGALGAAAGAAIGGTLGSVLPGIGTAIGAYIGSSLASSIFGTWKTKDYGLALSVDGGAFDAESYKKQKKSGLFGSKKRTKYGDVPEETAAQLASTYAATESGVESLFEQLGYSIDNGTMQGLDIARQKISTKGKTEEEIQQALNDWFGGVADSMTSYLDAAFGAGLGEMNYEELAAFVGNLQDVNGMLTNLNVGLFESSVAGGRMAENLSAIAGGFETLSANAAIYYDQFFTSVEKADDTLGAVTKTFADAGQSLPGTRDAYRAMVEDIDIASESGRSMFATMMALAGQADAYYDILEQRASDLLQAELDYYQLFTDEAQQVEDSLSGVRAQFAALNIELPASRQGFMDAVDAIDRTTESGRTMYETMLGLASSADGYYDVLEQRAADAQAAAQTAAEEAQAAAEEAAAEAQAAAEEAAAALADSVAIFYEQFTAETQRADDTLASVTAQFVALGVVLPEARDGFVQLVGGIDRTTESGQAAYASLMAAAGSADSYYDILEQRAADAQAAAEEAAAAADQAAEEAAATQQANIEAYYAAFVDESQQARDSIADVIEQFREAGVVLPASREQYRALVESIDTGTESGEQLYGTLMSLAGAADSAYASLDSLRASVSAAVDAAIATGQQAVQDAQQAVMDAYQDEASTLEGVIDTFDRFAESLRDFRESLRDSALEMQSPEQQLSALRRQFSEVAAAAAAGDRDALSRLPEVGGDLASKALELSASRADYLRELAYLQSAAAAAEGAAGEQVSVAQQQLDALNAQLEQLGLAAEAQQSFADAVLQLLQAQIDAAKALSDAQIAALKANMAWSVARLEPLLGSSGAIAAALSENLGIIDASLDGLLDPSELRAALVDTGLLTGAELDALIEAIDTNGDGLIDAIEQGNLDLIAEFGGYADDVNAAYREVLGRDADAPGLDYWADLIESGAISVDKLVDAILAGASGAEDQTAATAYANSVVDSAYQDVLGRSADAQSLDYWSAALQSGAIAVGSLQEVIAAAAVNGTAGSDQEAAKSYIDSLVDSAYQSVLGREADASGKEWWTNLLGSGRVQFEDFPSIFAVSAFSGPDGDDKTNAARYLEIPGYASGGDFGGGLRLVGESGPELEVTGPSRIYSASQTAELLSGGAPTAAALNGLQQAIAGLRDGIRSIAKHTMQTARRVEFLERWDFDGLPETRTA